MIMKIKMKILTVSFDTTELLGEETMESSMSDHLNLPMLALCRNLPDSKQGCIFEFVTIELFGPTTAA